MATKSAGKTACYVYGIVPADVEVNKDSRGLGGKVSVIRHKDIGALVSEVGTDKPLGKPEDLAMHAKLLDSAAAETPVLPIRFGAVLSDEQAVAEELLSGHYDEFVAALRELEGKAQYVVKGRYDEKAILSEVLSGNEDAQRLREAIRGKEPDAARDDRIALGEMVNNEITARRDADTRRVVDVMDKLGFPANVREPTHEEDAVHVACLAETQRQSELEDALTELAQEWADRVHLRLLGPLAAYDFVVTPDPEG